jgi:hypothetical protein
MKKRLALTLAASMALIAIGFMYQNHQTSKVASTQTVAPFSAPVIAESSPKGVDSQQLIASSFEAKNKGPLSITAKKTSETRFDDTDEANEAEGIESENEVDDDEGPLVNGRRVTKQQRINEAVALEFERTQDPALGYVPTERNLVAFEQTRRLQAQFQQRKDFLRGPISNAKWQERGPSNVGGRTRAILVDRNDPSGNTVFVGSALGGLFKNTDITNASNPWLRVNDWLDNLTISSLAQDPLNPKTMYAGSGDTDANDARGLGIFKSIDGGKTWVNLPSTSSASGFNSVAAILITPDNSTIYAATSAGLQRSKDGGATWEKVLGSGVGGNSDRIYGIQLGSDKRLYASTTSAVYKSTQGGNAGTWTQLTGLPGWTRTEIAVAPTDPNVIYAVGSANGSGSNVYRSADGGATWQSKTQPTWQDGCGGAGTTNDFTRGQAWYDLCITVDPTNANNIWIGGVDMFRSTDGGNSWIQGSYWANCQGKRFAHADHHTLYFDPVNPSILYVGTDGGVYRVTNAAASFAVEGRNLGFITTLFYGCAIHGDSAVNYAIAGAQDNGNIILKGKGIANVSASGFGGDGFLTFIDQNQSDIQIGSSYNGVWYLSTDGGAGFSAGANSNGNFFTPADYDDKNNIFYAQTRDSDLFRWNLNDKTQVQLDLAGVTLKTISNIFADENVTGRVYIGLTNGVLYRSNGTNTGASISDVRIAATFPGAISCVDVERGNPDHILVTLSNYGVQSIWESKDGVNFTSCDVGTNLPDMPIRWGVFNPNDANSALIATNMGVWTTATLNGAATVWEPPVPLRGTPLVRTDRIEWRKSDKMLIAGTFGRGIWTSSSLGKAQAVADYPAVTYLDVPVSFNGESSIAADRYKWLFSDNGATDTLENTRHSYNNVGRYDVSLTINNDNLLKTVGKIQVLPSLPTPYKSGSSVYAGGFEDATSDVHFGAWNTGGSKWERGTSAVPGKSGTHSGTSAYVLEKTANQYKKNTVAYLHTPNFDMSKGGIYQFSFWANYATQQGYDGFKVEYTLDKGLTWKQLGSIDDADWYNYKNTSLIESAAFGRGESYISGIADDWSRFKLNVSAFAGSANVAFRFVFKSDNDNVTDSGVAIDDVVLSRYDGKLETTIISQGGAYDKAGTSINVNFQSQPEYFAQTFTVQQSTNGRVWSDVETIKAKGISSEELQDYTVEVKGTPLDLYYYRIKSVNADAKTGYNFNFTTPPFAVRRNKDLPLSINRVFPSPFTNVINVTFTDIVTSEVIMTLYDDLGRLIATQTTTPSSVYQDFKVGDLAKGIYFLTVKIGDGKPETTKLFGAGNY